MTTMLEVIGMLAIFFFVLFVGITCLAVWIDLAPKINTHNIRIAALEEACEQRSELKGQVNQKGEL